MTKPIVKLADEVSTMTLMMDATRILMLSNPQGIPPQQCMNSILSATIANLERSIAIERKLDLLVEIGIVTPEITAAFDLQGYGQPKSKIITE